MKNVLKKVFTIGAALAGSVIVCEIVDNHIWVWKKRKEEKKKRKEENKKIKEA